MALLFIDGFDADDYSTKWDTNDMVTSNVITRFGEGRSLFAESRWYSYATRPITPSDRVRHHRSSRWLDECGRLEGDTAAGLVIFNPSLLLP